MRVRSLRPALLLLAAACPAYAAPASPDIARQLEQGYADYFGRAAVDKGVVKVTPEGDDYVVAWDLAKGLELLGADAGALRAATFAYRLTSSGDGAWRLAADAFPTLTIDAPTDAGQTSGTVELRGFGLHGTYDPAQAEFLRAEFGIDVASAKMKVADAHQTASTDFSESGISGEARAKTAAAGGGVDVAAVQRIASLSETIVGTPADGGEPVALTYTVGGGTGEATMTGLRGREIAEAWKYLVAHGEEAPVAHEFAAKLRAALPLWNEFHGAAKLADFAVKGPFGQAKMTSLAETIALSGLTAPATAEFGVKLEGLTIDSPQAPAWTAKLAPASVDVDLKFTGGGFDKAAEIVLADPSFDATGDLSSEAQDKIDAAVIAGDPKLTLAPGRLTTPTFDLAFEGEAGAVGGEPRGRLILSAGGFDKALALLRDAAPGNAEAESAILGLTFAKGLAKSGPDGRLLWTIEFNGADVTVNGSPLPTGK